MPTKRFFKLSGITRFSPREFRRVTTEMYSQNLELVQVNKTLSLLNAINLIVLQPDTDMRQVCNKIASSMVSEYGACVYTALFCREYENSRSESLMAWSSDWDSGTDVTAARRFIQHLNPSLSYDWGGGISLTEDMATIGEMMRAKPEDVKQFASTLRIKHFYVAKLVGSSGTIGTLMIGLNEDGALRDKKLLRRISDAISIALDNKLLQEENQRILQRLRESNSKLKRLDQTKDDFISMASHQLRTPLTSVKGYVSMVLDGDAGKISALQRKLLNQSFISSQRMVYLIADLLNVSRLRTGKFIIEAIPSNLARVVEEEVGQLKETAKGRNLELMYHKPEHFPTLMLDETKLRQVIMNFIDNAIYYTPSGGKIEVVLLDKPQTIECLVIDNGMGVPKREQPHLFSKFFRAHNAKRARPDGTGLGLFMAKKVIIAQGGAIIFKSQEDKGSTFGFTFAKEKLRMPPAKTTTKLKA